MVQCVRLIEDTVLSDIFLLHIPLFKVKFTGEKNYGSTPKNVIMQVTQKLNGVALLIVDPFPVIFTTTPSRLVCQDKHLCLDWIALVALSGKTVVNFEPIMRNENPPDFIMF